jgi:hypothetical protein
MAQEDSFLLQNSIHHVGPWYKPDKYPFPLDTCWRISHTIGYFTGGFTFFVGSLCYFPALTNYELGGWLFTIGSAGFLFADLFEWYTNNRVGCFDNAKLRADFEAIEGGSLPPRETDSGSWQRKRNGVNFFFSACGSFLYLLGSIFFIPELNAIVLGSEVFIVGSAFIFLSQGWKLSRYPNFHEDVPAVHVDAGAGIGGVFYFIGSIYFLPSLCVTDADVFRAAMLFTLGGLSFFYSACAIIFRYFITKELKYHH